MLQMKDRAIEAFLDEMAKRVAEKSIGYKIGPSGAPTTNYIHGPGGIFGYPGIGNELFSTRIQPMGLASKVPSRGTNEMNPLFGYITGFLDGTGANKMNVCDDAPVAGPVKSCLQTATFGRYEFATEQIEFNRVGQTTNRGEFWDLRLVNDPLLADMGGMTTPNVPQEAQLRSEVLSKFIALGVSFQNKLTRQIYSANPANNTPGGGYKEFPGLNILIGTDKFDAVTGASCPALNSDIKNFNYQLVTDSTPLDIVENLTYMARYLKWNAQRMNMDPTEWVITMRPELFYELTAVWPCSYLTFRCFIRSSQTSTVRDNIDARDAIEFRDEMRAGSYLLIDGVQWPVIQDLGIKEESSTDTNKIGAAQFASDIYFVPMTVRGGVPVTYYEYLDYSMTALPGVQEGRYTDFFWTDGGRFFWTKKPPQNWCVQWQAKIEPRLIFRAPQLAGRLQNVKYQPLQHTRTPFPDDPYFLDGGVTSRQGPSFYSDWNKPS